MKRVPREHLVMKAHQREDVARPGARMTYAGVGMLGMKAAAEPRARAAVMALRVRCVVSMCKRGKGR